MRNAIQRGAGMVFLLDDIPLRAADGFAELEEFVPTHGSFAHRRTGLSAVFLDMDRQRTAGKLLENGIGIAAAAQAIADVKY